MTKKERSRGFTLYLLKKEVTPDLALKDDHGLKEVKDASKLPEGARMFLSNNKAKEPWWGDYFGVNNKLLQKQEGALVFIKIDERWVVLSFGMSFHKLSDTSYEYNFGLITTLNMLDPEKIKSADIMKPEDAKRQRVQSPIATNLNLFNIEHNESIMRGLTGAVKDEYKELFKNVTGFTSLKVSLKIVSSGLNSLCEKLLDIYNKEDYKIAFPEINNISPVKDPVTISSLNKELLKAFEEAPKELVLTIPEIIDYNQSYTVSYTGAGKSNLEFDDVYIAGYREYLVEKGIEEINDTNIFKKHKLVFLNDNSTEIKQYSVYKCFLFECQIEGRTYHLNEGEWYEINSSFIEDLAKELDPIFISKHNFLVNCNKKREDAYNTNISKKNNRVICLDKQNISPKGQYSIEPCDLIAINEKDILEMMHIKISTRSASLSHLFNQGINSIEALRLIEESREKLKELVENNIQMGALIDKNAFSVTYGIITAKDDKKSDALPIFSRISLHRVVKSLTLMGVPCNVFLIKDEVDRKTKKEAKEDIE
ncbi:DUF6119 family protein [Myroides odoratimimus]|uniref:DUF6119 family protein n=1 Tax=Myroides odoratimimus TaxID=76832 RepID=UPI001CE07E3D|nr:DUF6119 family protein [Myroides odoratimimus]MCA4792688.1 TIGR04141 family sporadically distributed protein [Myroides odoratimimus]MCA4819870.1 TIGR04141 family sporadically distributed protein [Myroides odoratimimus]MDM1401241.1 TIGR04141 family sporadically distributed protein [Myroides odoratimimus]MDM1457209.1 TIGR04141 family sporadically distributed protein [Myroides odoratimimus]MEC4085772.1 DUF6119 family protein [Myroides odoratimimus]